MMTQEKFEQAKMIEQRIQSIDKLISLFSAKKYNLDPPTKMSSYTVYKNSTKETVLNEAEAALFLNALIDEKNRLQQEFGRL